MSRARSGRRALGALALLAVALHALAKWHSGLLPEMLWACTFATSMVGVGVLFRLPRLAAVGFVFHLGMGLPGWLLDIAATGTTAPTSIPFHLVPLAAGALEVRASGIPRWAALAAWATWIAVQAIAFFTTDPALNVNLAHRVWEPFVPWFSSVWSYRLFNAALAVPFLLTADFVARRYVQAPLRDKPERVSEAN